MLKTILIILVVGAVGAGAAVVYGPALAKNVVPQFFLARAAANTAAEFSPALEAIQALTPHVLSQPLRHELTLNLNNISGQGLTIHPALLSALPVISLRSDTRFNNSRDAALVNLSLLMAATEIAEADIFLDRNQMIINLPQLFDYGISLDPRRLGTEIMQSPLGIALPEGLIDDERFYRLYNDFIIALRANRGTADFSRFILSLPALALTTSIDYIGRESLPQIMVHGMILEGFDREQPQVDVFHMNIPTQEAASSLTFLLEALGFADHLTVTSINENTVVFVGDNRIAGLDITFSALDILGAAHNHHLQMRFYDTGELLFNLTSSDAGGVIQTTWGRVHAGRVAGNQAIDFFLSVHTDYMGNNINLRTEGNIRLFPDDWRIEADVRGAVNTDTMDVNLNTRNTISANHEPIGFSAENTRPLTSLSLFDLLGIYARLQDTPLGGFLGN